MSESYLGEIRMFAGNYAPQGWALCDGQLLSINEYENLFILLGTTFGGDGQNTFGLPDLRGRLPVHPNRTTILQGSKGGTETVTLTQSEMPAHTHAVNAIADEGTAESPDQAYWSKSDMAIYTDGTSGKLVSMSAQAIQPAGLGQPHSNMMPSLAISFIISLYGIYPTEN
ncbi:phage tail protein [Xylanibacillus composti]|uniref:Microcystin dependent MdpB family protein n=1 Tax=Xylanibacillus composti TaxID=1572762 RepID=A0A8J4H6Q2_9BACL|nr:tail fiber protein [Xylanibacillus composti]MDT9726517.1 phage tail protein [Xylanibacillus composti]GIQ69909.1 microcystin dependent MdpB family protein [Xylanibacillus composti]